MFINLWATYCGPCVKELPFFSELYKAHEGDIAMLALHSDIVDDDPKEYLNEHGKDWVMPFAVENRPLSSTAMARSSTTSAAP